MGRRLAAGLPATPLASGTGVGSVSHALLPSLAPCWTLSQVAANASSPRGFVYKGREKERERERERERKREDVRALIVVAHGVAVDGARGLVGRSPPLVSDDIDTDPAERALERKLARLLKSTLALALPLSLKLLGLAEPDGAFDMGPEERAEETVEHERLPDEDREAGRLEE
jgi:hypothetical protein